MPEPTDDRTGAPTFGSYYFSHNFGIPYERNEYWLSFFGDVADRLIRRFQPRTVLDAGCAIGLLVEAFRVRGVEAYGFDVSKFALEQTDESVAPYCRHASLSEGLPSDLPDRYDLVTCIEVIEHIPVAEETDAMRTLLSASDRIFFSSSPVDYGEATHVNVHQPEYWAVRFAELGFVRDVDAVNLLPAAPWASVFERRDASPLSLIEHYERAFWKAQFEAAGEPARAEVARLREALLVSRDAVIGNEAALGEALGRIRLLESELARYVGAADRLAEVLASSSWRYSQALLAPYRKLRGRQGP
ncbi:MAG: class I SAM-dependent methyltransferase [Actinobacteria bacterium]|nr:MAG: class I SAM-dependent methyltransferase [Actinomycetota bacterium]